MTHDHARLAAGERRHRMAPALAGCVLAMAAMSHTAGAETAPTARQQASFRVRAIVRGPHHIYAREYPGAEPTLVLMHGFPDDLQLYDRLVPLLSGRHVVVFDFLGWGRSDKPDGYPYTFDNLKGDLDAVMTQLGLSRAVLVAHDASGPPAINWALEHPDRVVALVLLNTFYHLNAGLQPPEAIAIFGDLLSLNSAAIVRPETPFSFARLSLAISASPQMGRWLYFWQVGRFMRDEPVRRQFLRKLWARFGRSPSSIPAFVSLNRDLQAAVVGNTARVSELAGFIPPVRIVFGATDPYMNPAVAESFHQVFLRSEKFLVPNAGHYVQLDEPDEVARLLLPVGVP